MFDEDERTWLLDAGDNCIEKESTEGFEALPAVHRLVYCLWVADYGMTNAGDLAVCHDIRETFLSDGRVAARELGLPISIAAFSMAPEELEQRYFELFGDVVREIKSIFVDEGAQP